jgi:hypothetical protein
MHSRRIENGNKNEKAGEKRGIPWANHLKHYASQYGFSLDRSGKSPYCWHKRTRSFFRCESAAPKAETEQFIGFNKSVSQKLLTAARSPEIQQL